MINNNNNNNDTVLKKKHAAFVFRKTPVARFRIIFLRFMLFSKGKYWMDNTRCGGQELELSECRFDSWGENDCDPSEAAGVVCEVTAKKHESAIAPSLTQAVKKVQKHRIKVRNISSRFSNFYSSCTKYFGCILA